MLDCALLMKNAIHLLLNEDKNDNDKNDLTEFDLTMDDWENVKHTHKFLRRFADVSIYLESNNYTTVSKVVPMFNILLDHIEDSIDEMKDKNPELCRAANNAWYKIAKYYSKTHSMNMALTVLDPRLNLQYLLDEGFNHDDIEETKLRLNYIYKEYSTNFNTE
jgi:hypothetical protein